MNSSSRFVPIMKNTVQTTVTIWARQTPSTCLFKRWNEKGANLSKLLLLPFQLWPFHLLWKNVVWRPQGLLKLIEAFVETRETPKSDFKTTALNRSLPTSHLRFLMGSYRCVSSDWWRTNPPKQPCVFWLKSTLIQPACQKTTVNLALLLPKAQPELLSSRLQTISPWSWQPLCTLIAMQSQPWLSDSLVWAGAWPFRLYDCVLKLIIQARNPFIYPEGQLKTWGDCLLMFVSRLPCRSNKKRGTQKRDKR